MEGKDLKVKIIHRGLKVIATEKGRTYTEPFSVLQHFTDFIGTRTLTSTIAEKHRKLLQLNQNLLRRLSKK